jgi:hypothetical protein
MGGNMKATIPHGQCHCNCGNYILAGSDFVILEGAFFLKGHENFNVLEEAGIYIRRNYEKFAAKQAKEQKPIADLPLFDTESKTVCQLSLF